MGKLTNDTWQTIVLTRDPTSFFLTALKSFPRANRSVRTNTCSRDRIEMAQKSGLFFICRVNKIVAEVVHVAGTETNRYKQGPIILYHMELLKLQQESADFHGAKLNNKIRLVHRATPHSLRLLAVVSFNLPAQLLHLRLLLIR